MIKEVQAKSILRKHKKLDSWFVSRYGMNLYRGCTHNCAYCDGRAEGYYVSGEFGKDIEVKVNAIQLLEKELNPARKRVPFEKGFAMIGGGVCDGYQPVEEKYMLTRKALDLVNKYGFPVHMLTKSTLILRDIDILDEINKKTRALVSFSFSSCNDKISKIFEPGVPVPSERLEAIKLLKKRGISCGMFLMPVIPFITDSNSLIEDSVVKAKEAGIDFIIFSGMTLKEGRQKEHFFNILDKYDPSLKQSYDSIYTPSKWGGANEDYFNSISRIFYEIAKKYKMPIRIPLNFFKDNLNENEKVSVILEHIDYILKMKGERSPYSYAAWSVSGLNVPIRSMCNNLKSLKGVGNTTEKIILEILATGTGTYYEKLINFG